MVSKLPGGIMERWKRSVLKIGSHQHQEPNLKDITEFVEDETMTLSFLVKHLGNSTPSQSSIQGNGIQTVML